MRASAFTDKSACNCALKLRAALWRAVGRRLATGHTRALPRPICQPNLGRTCSIFADTQLGNYKKWKKMGDVGRQRHAKSILARTFRHESKHGAYFFIRPIVCVRLLGAFCVLCPRCFFIFFANNPNHHSLTEPQPTDWSNQKIRWQASRSQVVYIRQHTGPICGWIICLVSSVPFCLLRLVAVVAASLPVPGPRPSLVAYALWPRRTARTAF